MSKLTSTPQKTIPVTQLIAKSRFALRTDYFDVKIVRHISQELGQSDDREVQKGRPLKGRLVIAVPCRVGSAPVRNRCRRRIRELMRTMGLSLLPCDFIFFVRTSCATVPIEKLREMLEKLRIRAQKMCL